MRREILRTLVAVIAVDAVPLACSSGGSSGGLSVSGGRYPPAMSGDNAAGPGTVAGDAAGQPGAPMTGRGGNGAREHGTGYLLDNLADVVPDAEVALNETTSGDARRPRGSVRPGRARETQRRSAHASSAASAGQGDRAAAASFALVPH